MTVVVDLQAFAPIARAKTEELLARRSMQYPDVEFNAIGVDFYFQAGVLNMALDTAENLNSLDELSIGSDANGAFTNNVLDMSHPLEEDLEIPGYRDFMTRYFASDGGESGNASDVSIRTCEGFVVENVFQQMRSGESQIELLVLALVRELFISPNNQHRNDSRGFDFGDLSIVRPFRVTSYAPEGCHGFTFLI